MDKLEMKTKSISQENVAKIQALFPNAVTEVIKDGKVTLAVDFDVLKQELSESLISEGQERYQMTWPDKRKSVLLANSSISATLRPCKEESVDFDNTQNLYIEGDNLEVLKLLRETYLGKVKMIYIDPPYNTGNDFVYNDDFAIDSQKYMENSGQYDEEGNRLEKNLESNGRFHTDWLNMIYPRLKVAKDLLSDDGVIFISIDDNEVGNLRKICDEVFGADNFIECLKWKRKKQPSFLSKHTAKIMEYILVYAKHYPLLEKLSIETISDSTKKVVNLTNNFSVRHFKAGFRTKSIENGVIQKGKYTIKTMTVEYLNDIVVENGRSVVDVDVVAQFTLTQDNIDKYISEDLLFVTANNGLRRDVSEAELGTRKSITDLLLDWGDNQDSDNEIRTMFGSSFFDYTKPVKLIHNLCKAIYGNDFVVLDFFSGSATTAHAVMQLNVEDGGNRKFIMVQLPEPCDEKSEAYKAGYKNICEIGKERIRRAGAKIKEEFTIHNSQCTMHNSQFEMGDDNYELSIKNYELDVGFRVLKLDSSNMQDVYYNPSAMTQSLLDATIDNVKPDRTPMDLLFQVMLELGIELSAKIEEKELGFRDKELGNNSTSPNSYPLIPKSYKVYIVDDNDIIACFDDNLNNEVITEIAKLQPLYAVFKDKSFATDSVGINNEQIFKTYSPITKVKVI